MRQQATDAETSCEEAKKQAREAVQQADAAQQEAAAAVQEAEGLRQDIERVGKARAKLQSQVGGVEGALGWGVCRAIEGAGWRMACCCTDAPVAW